MRFRKRRILLILIIISTVLCAASFLSLVLSIIQKSFSNNSYRASHSKCETVHVGIVSTGYEGNFDFHTMLKSLYFHRNHPLHLHVIVDDISEHNLKILFNTWAVPHVAVTFYNIHEFAPYLGHLFGPTHDLTAPELLKLVFAKLIPHGITNRLIVLDQHLFFADDVFDLWKLFDGFSAQQVIGLVESQTHDSLKDRHGKKFNYGVVLAYLERFRKIGWDDLWMVVTNETASRIGAHGLSDQNIINAVVSENFDLVYVLPCHWNTHFHSSTNDYSCYNNNEIKIMHWNFPKKPSTNADEVDYFTAMHTMFAHYNGNLLRKDLHGCTQTEETTVKTMIDECFDFHQSYTNHWRTLLFFEKFKYAPDKNDVTFVSQLTYDRIKLLEEICDRWDGPMSLTFYVTDVELQKTINFIENSTILQNRFNIAYHAVFKEDYYHPINILRNVALKHVVTPYLFTDDIDLLPMQGMYASLKEYIAGIGNMGKKALVVPAFQTMQYGGEIPKSRIELLRMLEMMTLIPFSFWRFPEGHGPTNYTLWKNAVAPYKIEWKPNYEPYVVVQKNVPEYDERFVGYGWDKTSYIMKLEAQGYDFIVLPNSFVAHKDHPPSSDESHFLELPRYRRCLENLSKKVVQELNENYNRTFSVST